MLVLTRKVGDVIAIGDNIKIIVMAIKGKQVRLGIEADRSTVDGIKNKLVNVVLTIASLALQLPIITSYIVLVLSF